MKQVLLIFVNSIILICPVELIGLLFYRFIFPKRKSTLSFILATSFIIGIPVFTFLFSPLFYIFHPTELTSKLLLLLSTFILLIIIALKKKKHITIFPFQQNLTYNIKNKLLFVFLLLIILLLAFLPLSHLGRHTSQGYAYRAYFSADYLKHIAITEEISKFTFPPLNPYFSTSRLHYYWLFYCLPAIGVRSGMSAETVLIIFHLISDLAFLIILWETIGLWTVRKPDKLLLFLLLTVATSFEGLYVLIIRHKEFSSLLAFFSRFNIDAATRWFLGNPQFDSFYRTMIYTPQHLISLTFLLLIFHIYYSNKRLSTTENSDDNHLNNSSDYFQGSLAGLSFLWSALVGVIVVFWIVLVKFFDMLHRPYRLSSFYSAVRVAVPLFIAASLSLGLKMIVPGGSPLKIVGMSPLKAAEMLFLNFGILFLLGILGLFTLRNWRNSYREILLILISIPFGLFIQIKDFPSDIGLKAGLVIIVALIAPSAYFLNWTSKREKIPRLFVIFVYFLLFIGVIAAFPTILIDVYNSSDTNNQHFTTYVSNEDMQAAIWIKKNIPSNAIMQEDPARRASYYSLLPTFAGRRIAAGDTMHSHIFQISQTLYLKRKEKIQTVYASRNALKAWQILHSLQIKYLYFGEKEAAVYGAALQKFAANPQLFKLVYNKQAARIFQISSNSFKVIRDIDFSKKEGFPKLTFANPNVKSQMEVTIESLKQIQNNRSNKFTLQIPAGRIIKNSVSIDAEVNNYKNTNELLISNNYKISVRYPIKQEFSASDMMTLVGHRHFKNELKNKQELVSKSTNKGFLVYGPYKYFPSGKYQVFFNLELIKSEGVVLSAKNVIAVLDVYASEQKKQLKTQKITVSNMKQNTNQLIFILKQPAMLEFRVFQTGIVKLVFKNVTIQGLETPFIIETRKF